MHIDDLNKYLLDLLYFDGNMNVKKIDPYMSNGLMIKGKSKVGKIGFGVSASLELFRKAAEVSCDVIVTHHSFNFPAINSFDSLFQNRFGFLVTHGISLFGFHFLLDAHPKFGNNAQLLKVLGAEVVEPFLHRGNPWGWIGFLKQEKTFDQIVHTLNQYMSPRAILYNFGKERIKKIAAVSGKGAPLPSDMPEMIEKQIDLFITGEIHEWNRELFREAKIHCIAGGHYATEVFGIKALMGKVKSQFPEIETIWLDLPNEV